ncbi:MAG: tRNA lysidine(34) synthetase TilS [Planctomycetaceae bacterium]|nr:tRNA lysidine(34) synthetase TilS [Planctomycetaceae bacterium]
MALLRGLSALKRGGEGRLVVAHFNHQLRGGESDADERFVGRLADQLGLRFESGRLEPAELDACSEGIEEAARNLRYRFLTDAAERIGARYVVCAHTADDQIETILHRIVRGTGIAGLAGIPRCRQLSPAVTVIRPLLNVRRSEVLEYLAFLGQPYRDDRSNSDRRFTRNRIRRDLLPHLAEHYNPAVAEALLRLGRLAAEAQEVVDGLVRRLVADGVVAASDDGLLVVRSRVADQPDYLVRELLMHAWQAKGWPMQSMGFDEWNRLLQMVRNDPRSGATALLKRTFPGPIQAECLTEGLHLRPQAGSEADRQPEASQ